MRLSFPSFLVYRFAFAALLLLSFSSLAVAQKADIRGFVYDKSNGQPLAFVPVQIEGTTLGANTDPNGFYNISGLSAGDYVLSVKYLGFDSTGVKLKLSAGAILSQSFYLSPASVEIREVEISARKETKRNDVQISVTKISAKDLKSIPATGGEPDLAQYLQVLPGVIFTGDQGGQLYIRGGSPVQNRMMIDGMTVYNPFHSIGFFSVFETEAIRNVDVYTGGFAADYGGRTSAIVDIQTKDGNKKRWSGLASASPFQAKVLVEGPIIPLTEDGNSMSLLVTGKYSYLPQSSKVLYNYINPNGLPYGYGDGYAKLSFNTKSGSRFSLSGFNFNDIVAYGNTNLNWSSTGYGGQFLLVPDNAKLIISGGLSGSSYNISMTEANGQPRTSGISGFQGGLNFTSYGEKTELKYGVELSGFRTDFAFTNALGYGTSATDNNTEIGIYLKYKVKIGRLILEPSMRAQYYASLSEFSPEPRLGIKYNATSRLRFKFGGGLYSQNLISAVSERDIVNLFVGFLASPEDLTDPKTGNKPTSALQKAYHLIGGVEYDVSKNISINVEPYYKGFTQLIGFNRAKLANNDPDFATETGAAYGIDFSSTYKKRSLSLTANYSYSFVNRNDGTQTYPTNFDRRHNVNLIGNYAFGKHKVWEAGVRWNYGSGFPFTLTQGFYENLNTNAGVQTDVLHQNGDVGILYSANRNGGRLPDYHRLDLSLKRIVTFSKYSGLELTAALTNAYNRPNIFYFDRVSYQRVNQLPILPSLVVLFKW